MLGEQLQLLFTLYVRPVRAASRIIDHGRLWFALCAALLVLWGLPNRAFARGLMSVIDPAAVIRTIGATALAFVPAVILVMTLYRSHESFPVMLRKDYLTLLNCVLFSLSAAFLPLAILSRMFVFANYELALAILIADEIYFLVLVMYCVRTLWGSRFAVAGGAAIVGLMAMFVGMVAFLLLGSFMYFLASPFLL